jgi:hypothetical protein
MTHYFDLKEKPDKHKGDAPTPELDSIIDAVREESEESSDDAGTAAQDTCACSSVNINSEVNSEESLPVHKSWRRLGHHTRIESEESEESEESSDDGGVGGHARQSVSEDDTEDKEIHAMSKHLDILRHKALVHQGRPTSSTLKVLGNQPKLREASTELTKASKRCDLDVAVRTRIAAMIGLLEIYTDKNLGYSWREASELVAKTQRRGTHHARCIREWVLDFLNQGDLPLHQLNWKRSTILDDKDIAEDIKARMMEKGGFLKAEDVVEIVASPEIQVIFARKGITKATISTKTALRWLEKLGWTYGRLQNGMYLDGHERPDVVEYRKAFVERWMGHERRFHRWDDDGTELPRPNGFAVPGAIGRFRLILVTHDESTFFQNDERNTGWRHASSKSKPKAKGNGQTLMVSDFLTPDWGRLRDGDE